MMLWIPIALALCVRTSLASTMKPLNIVLEIDRKSRYLQGSTNIELQVFDVAELDYFINMHYLKKTINRKVHPVPFLITGWKYLGKPVKVDTSAFHGHNLKSVRVCIRKGAKRPAVLEVEVMNDQNGAGGPFFYLVATKELEYERADISKYNMEGAKLTYHQILDLMDDVIYTFNDALLLNIDNKENYGTATKRCTVTHKPNYPASGYDEYQHDVSPHSFVPEVVRNGVNVVKCGELPKNVTSASVYWSLGYPVMFRVKSTEGYTYYAKIGNLWQKRTFGKYNEPEYSKKLAEELDNINSQNNYITIDIAKNTEAPYKSGAKSVNVKKTAGKLNADPPYGFHKFTHTLQGKFNVARFVDGGAQLKFYSKHSGFMVVDGVDVYFSELQTQHIPVLICVRGSRVGGNSDKACLSLAGNKIWADYTFNKKTLKNQLEDILYNSTTRRTLDISKKAEYGKPSSMVSVNTFNSNPFTVYVHEFHMPSIVSSLVNNGKELSGMTDINDYVVRAKVYFLEGTPRYIFLHNFSSLLFCSGDRLGKWTVDKRITDFSHANVSAIEKENASYFDPTKFKTEESYQGLTGVRGAKGGAKPGWVESAEEYLNMTSQDEETEEDTTEDNHVVSDSERVANTPTGKRPEQGPRHESTTDVVARSHNPQMSHGDAESKNTSKNKKPKNKGSQHLTTSMAPQVGEESELKANQEGESDAEKKETEDIENKDLHKRDVEELMNFAGFSIFDLFSLSSGFHSGSTGLLLCNALLYAFLYF